MRPLKITLVGLVVLLAIAVGYGYGCGDSSDESAKNGGAADATGAADTTGTSDDDSRPVVEKAQFLEKGDAICRKVPAAYKKLVQPLEKESLAKGTGKPPLAEVNLTAAVPPLGVAIEEFEELDAPQGDEQEVEEIIEALKAAKKGVEEKPTTELSGPKSPFDDFQNLSRAYGFERCNRL